VLEKVQSTDSCPKANNCNNFHHNSPVTFSLIPTTDMCSSVALSLAIPPWEVQWVRAKAGVLTGTQCNALVWYS